MKNYDQLTIRDHFMFGKICEKPKNSQLILRALLDDPTITISNTEVEKYYKPYSDNKYVRLDLLA